MIDFALPPFEFPKPAIIRPAPAEMLRYGGDPVAVALQERQRRQGLVAGAPKATAKKKASSATITYVDFAASASATMNLGSGTHCILAIGGRASANRSISSVVVDGASATQVRFASRNVSGLSYAFSALYIVAKSGSGKSVTVTWNAAMSATMITTSSAENLLSATPTATAADSTGNPVSADIDCQAGGIIIGCVANSQTSFTWSNLTERQDNNDGSQIGLTTAFDAFAAAQSARSISCTASTNQFQVMTLASFR